jgi:arylsulfatase A-like enzyme
MHNMLIAAGPDFRRGEVDDLPTGNVDLAPTILQILGIKAPMKTDGRILAEPMVSSHVGVTSRNGGLQSAERVLSRQPETKTLESIKDFPSGAWRQTLKISRVGSTIYLDEGNGAFTAKQRAAVSSSPN